MNKQAAPGGAGTPTEGLDRTPEVRPMEQRSDAGATPCQQPFDPFSDPWPAGYTEEDFGKLVLEIIVELVKQGDISADRFVSPEAYRRFCDKNGIER